MGKSVTPYSRVVDQVQASFAEFRRALPRPAQQRFDRLFNDARRHTAAGVLLSDPDPFRPVVLAMLIELLGRLEKRNGELAEDPDDDPDDATAPAPGGGAV